MYGSTLADRRIRLLRIESGSGDEVISRSLIEAALDEARAYYALSYTWGDPHQIRPISCDGKGLEITTNLHSALWQLREQRAVSLLWADAVCINQLNEEKTTQVRMMRDIYRQADCVIVWLGELQEADGVGFQLLEQIHHIAQDPKLLQVHDNQYIPVD